MHASIFNHYTDEYMKEFDKYCFPNKFGFEAFKMKKYEPNDIDEFGWHVDVFNWKYEKVSSIFCILVR